MTLEYTLVRQRRKTITVYVRANGVEVRAPLHMKQRSINEFLKKHMEWIENQIRLRAENADKAALRVLSEEERASLKKQAKAAIPQRVAHFAEIMGVSPTGVKITSAATRWGSCSSRNSLCFSYRVMLLPGELIDYIVVHELAHIREKNHSPAFYAVVERFMPDYKQRRERLKAV